MEKVSQLSKKEQDVSWVLKSSFLSHFTFSLRQILGVVGGLLLVVLMSAMLFTITFSLTKVWIFYALPITEESASKAASALTLGIVLLVAKQAHWFAMFYHITLSMDEEGLTYHLKTPFSFLKKAQKFKKEQIKDLTLQDAAASNSKGNLKGLEVESMLPSQRLVFTYGGKKSVNLYLNFYPSELTPLKETIAHWSEKPSKLKE